MNSPAKHALYTVITTIAIGVIAITMIFQLAQTVQRGRDNQRLSQEIKGQTTINQRYLKCLILLPPGAFSSTTTRVAAVDKCSVDSQIDTK